MLRADRDALPIEEATDLPYASRSRGGMAVFPPGEETAEGAQAMIDDGLSNASRNRVWSPSQHVMVRPAGTVAGRLGGSDSRETMVWSRSTVAAAITTGWILGCIIDSCAPRPNRRICKLSAAEGIAPTRPNRGRAAGGTKEKVIPDEAVIKLNVRTFEAGVRTRVLDAIERIANAEAAASDALRKPEITMLDQYPLNVNDPDASMRVVETFRGYFGPSGFAKRPPLRPAKTSDHSERNGIPHRSSGLWSARTRVLRKGVEPAQRIAGEP